MTMPNPVTIFSPVDRPSLHIVGRRFEEHVRVVGAPTYGRVLFRQHEALVADSVFRNGLEIVNCDGVTLVRNWVGYDA
jgi:hypothetical protein